MKIEILMAVMHQKDLSIAKACNADTDILVINQCDKNEYTEEVYRGNLIRMISTTERGVSKSRNMAIKNSSGDICIICDDDVTYFDGYKEKVLDAFSEKSDADIISFGIKYKNDDQSGVHKKINTSFCKAPWWRSCSSVSLAFKRKRILEKNIWFDDTFGAGSGVITSGEEALWQKNARKAGLKMYQHPFFMLTTDKTTSTWFEGYTEKYFYNMGAYVATAFPKAKHILKFYYVYRLNSLTNLKIHEQIRWLNAGIQGIKVKMPYEKYKMCMRIKK